MKHTLLIGLFAAGLVMQVGAQTETAVDNALDNQAEQTEQYRDTADSTLKVANRILEKTCRIERGQLTLLDPDAISGRPVVISSPGSYILPADLVVPAGSTIGIKISSSDVLLDLSGYTISQTGADAGVNAIDIAAGSENVTIKGGVIKNFTGNGVVVNGAARCIELCDLDIVDCGGDGIVFAGGVGTEIKESTICDCRVIGCMTNDTAGISYGVHLTYCDNCDVFRTQVRDTAYTGAAFSKSIYSFVFENCNECILDHCDATDIRLDSGSTTKAFFDVIGMRADTSPDSHFRDCHVRNLVLNNSHNNTGFSSVMLGIDILQSDNAKLDRCCIVGLTTTEAVSHSKVEVKGLRVISSRDSILRECIVEKVLLTLIDSNTFLNGIEIGTSDGAIIVGCIVSDMTGMDQPGILCDMRGIVIGTSDNVNILDSVVKGISSSVTNGDNSNVDGIRIENSINNVVKNCVVNDIFASGTCNGIYIFDFNSQFNTITNNVVSTIASRVNSFGIRIEFALGNLLFENKIIRVFGTGTVKAMKTPNGNANAWSKNITTASGGQSGFFAASFAAIPNASLNNALSPWTNVLLDN